MLMALQAGASGLTFTPVPGLLGSDLMTVRPDFRAIPDPYDPSVQVAVVPAITPDVALIHALRAGPDGTLVLPTGNDTALLAQAARTVIATVEALDPEPITHVAAGEQLLPGIYVDAVVLAPRGAHPLGCHPLYGDDAAHIRRYREAAREPAAFATYLHAYVHAPADHAAYLDLLGREPAHA